MELTPVEQRHLDLANWRVQVIRDLRSLAALLASTSYTDLPTPNVFLSLYGKPQPTDANPYDEPELTQADVRQAMGAAPGNWSKLNTDNQISYTKTVGESIRLHLYVNRANVCIRVQVGTKHVEATEAHDVPVYEWQCTQPELEV